MKYVYALAILACATSVTMGITCFPEICGDCSSSISEEDCVNEGRVYVENGTLCGCCPACLTKLNLNDDCGRDPLLAGSPPVAACAKGLSCTELTRDDTVIYRCIENSH